MKIASKSLMSAARTPQATLEVTTDANDTSRALLVKSTTTTPESRELLVVESGGDVGIGTSTPSNRLTVDAGSGNGSGLQLSPLVGKVAPNNNRPIGVDANGDIVGIEVSGDYNRVIDGTITTGDTVISSSGDWALGWRTSTNVSAPVLISLGANRIVSYQVRRYFSTGTGTGIKSASVSYAIDTLTANDGVRNSLGGVSASYTGYFAVVTWRDSDDRFYRGTLAFRDGDLSNIFVTLGEYR
ncbi:hypothetical protein OAS86_06920 [Gammaproteobacteria bacterium]|nr:hypothetical protein [Gammaproteobacteria bacterium]